MMDAGIARDYWSERVFMQAKFDAGMDSPEATAIQIWLLLKDRIERALRDPSNWKRVRFRRTPRMRAQAARVVRVLKRAKSGRLEPIR